MSELDQLSEAQKEMATKMISDDKGFHSTYLLANIPFDSMMSETDIGTIAVSECAMAEISDSASNYTIKVWLSEEQKCWFFLFTTGTDEIRGVLHFNTLYNARGVVSFAFLNNNQDNYLTAEQIKQNIAYSNILVMRK